MSRIRDGEESQSLLGTPAEAVGAVSDLGA